MTLEIGYLKKLSAKLYARGAPRRFKFINGRGADGKIFSLTRGPKRKKKKKLPPDYPSFKFNGLKI